MIACPLQGVGQSQDEPVASRRRFDSAQQETYLNLWRTYDRLKVIEEQAFGEFGLSAQQYNALRLLRSVHPQSMPVLVLGSRLISRAPDITRLLDRLEKRDLVQRVRRAENRRVVDVEIKPAGMELLDQLTSVVRRVNQSQLGHMKPAELKELTRLLEAARWPHEEPGGLWGRPESLATQSSSGAPVEGE
jgi:DNA-binding MarR family transcriptional regulator